MESCTITSGLPETIVTEIIHKSSSFNPVNKNEYSAISVVIIGLAYDKKELCRVFKDTTKEEYDDINYGRKGIINFKDNKITDSQLDNIRNCNSKLHIYLVKILVNKYDLKTTQNYDELF